MTVKTKNRRKKLQSLKGKNDLKDYVIDYILSKYNNYNEIETFFKDLFYAGCQSGMIRTLIYYKDTHHFYDEYYDDIEDLRRNIEDSLGEGLQPKGDLKNWYAWLGFEETAREVANDLGLDY